MRLVIAGILTLVIFILVTLLQNEQEMYKKQTISVAHSTELNVFSYFMPGEIKNLFSYADFDGNVQIPFLPKKQPNIPEMYNIKQNR